MKDKAMKKYLLKIGLLLLMVMLVLIFASCNNQINPTVEGSDYYDTIESIVVTESADSAYVYYDNARNMAVYVDDSGSEFPVQSEEVSGNVVCEEVIDFISVDSGNTLSRGAGFRTGGVKAFVLGKRSDDSSGLWVVYSDGRVSPVINSDGFDTSELLEMVEGRQPLSGYFSWSYEALDMISNADASEIIITGYAENSGVERHNYIVEEGTTIGVYWAVTLDDDGYYHISRAKVIGYKDNSSWKNYFWKNKKSDNRRQHRWMWTLRMFFAGWYDRYLVMPESIEPGENVGEYNIYGTDQEDEDALAVVTAKKVLSIEKYELPVPEDNPPVATFYDFDYLVSGAGDEGANGEYVESVPPAGYVDTEDYYSVPFYSNGSYYMFRFSSKSLFWGIGTDVTANRTMMPYLIPGNVAYRPPETLWEVSAGTPPAPEVRAVSPISGHPEIIGNTLRGNYIFSDIDGDAESGSIYKWYRCNSVDDTGAEIAGADEQAYIIDSDDENFYLRFEVTPVDDSGVIGRMTGSPLLSDAVFIGIQ